MQDQYPSMYQEMKPQLPDQEHLKCPRCGSLNTKFCYYNNYNLSQPRHFCKSCRRYWTKGGTLRNIPVGGATRKTTNTKRSSNPRRSSATALAIRKPEPNGTLALLASKVSQDPGISPSFRSLLTPNGQFGNLIYGLSSNGSTAKVGEFAGYSNSASQSSLIRYPLMKFQSSDNGETLLGGWSGGNSSCCGGGGGGNEYLAIFTPGSSYP